MLGRLAPGSWGKEQDGRVPVALATYGGMNTI